MLHFVHKIIIIIFNIGLHILLYPHRRKDFCLQAESIWAHFITGHSGQM